MREYAVEEAIKRGVPLLIFEGLRTSYPWSSKRCHQFVLEGMLEQQKIFQKHKVQYIPYVEPQENAGKGLMKALAEKAMMVVTDIYPAYFIPKMQKAFSSKSPCRVIGVDSNGLMPIYAPERTFARAYDYRRFVQKNVERFFLDRPKKQPYKSAKLIREPIDLTSIYERWTIPPLPTKIKWMTFSITLLICTRFHRAPMWAGDKQPFTNSEAF